MKTALLVAVVTLAGCTAVESALVAASTSTTATTVPATTTTTLRECHGELLPFSSMGDDPVAGSIAISMATFRCADRVLLAPIGDSESLAAAEAAGGGPLLLVNGNISPSTISEIRRLAPTRVMAAGLTAAELAPLTDVEPIPARIGTPGTPPIPGDDRLWLLSSTSPALVAAARVASSLATGSTVLVVEDRDLRAIADPDAIRLAAEVIPMGFLGSDWRWELDTIRSGLEIPGGGLLMFPGRRLVAFYGNPTTRALGVLGEQGPAETAERIAEVSPEYGADGLAVLPTFEIIATVASSRAGSDGDYSQEMEVADLRPWIDFAAENGIYVILDLQPGRTDFLTQAKRYQELLKLPHVGLAIDPEWRLKPGQVHLNQIGSVSAEEVNAVSGWLADLTRENALPQKLFLLHQFKFTMLPDRDLIVGRPELAMVLQMDGQGPLATKFETWRALTAGAGDVPWRWGWKSFYDEDSPMATAEQVLGLDPLVVLISFQ